MAAATCRIGSWNGASPTFTGGSDTGVSAEGGFKYSLDDNLNAGGTPIPIPTAANTVYSWRKYLGLEVTVVGTTSISNRRAYSSGAPSTGLSWWYRTYASGSYAQAASGTRPAQVNGSNGATPLVNGTPATPVYAALPTAIGAAWDNSSVASSTLGLNGTLLDTVLGVDFLFPVGSVGSAVALPNFNLTYDEA